MDLNRNTSTVVPDTNLALLFIDSYSNFVHVLVVLLIVRRVDEDLIEYLIKSGDV